MAYGDLGAVLVAPSWNPCVAGPVLHIDQSVGAGDRRCPQLLATE